MSLKFRLKWKIINPIFKLYCEKMGCKNRPVYKVSFTMPTLQQRLTQLLCPECAKTFLNWTEEERIRRENDDKLWTWAYENVVVQELTQ